MTTLAPSFMSTTMPRPRLPIVYTALVVVLVLSGLDQTLLSAALPAIVRELHGAERASWVFSAFLIASTAMIPLYGKLADRRGARPLLLVATAVFALGSLACGAAPGMDALIVARALQGAGGGGLMTLTMLAVASLYPPAERGTRLGLLGAAYGIAVMLGPLLGALVTQHLSWRWAFFANLPVTLAAGSVLAAAEFTPPTVAKHRIDTAGALLLALLLACVLLATRSRTLADAWPWLLTAALLLAGWLASERRAEDPIVPLSLFADRAFGAAAVISVAAGVALFAAVVFLPLYLQGALRLTPTASALHLLPLMGGITVAASLAGRALRAGTAARTLALVSGVAMGLGYAGVASVLWLVPASAISISAAVLPAGLGLGLLFPVLTVVAQRSAPLRQIGIATAMPIMLRALGGAIGAALLGELLHRHAGDGPAAAMARLFGCVAAVAALACITARRLPARLPPDPRIAMPARTGPLNPAALRGSP